MYDHDPIHIHAKYQGFESVYELHIDNGKLIEIKIRPVDNEAQLLPPAQHKKVIKFIKGHWKDVAAKWVDVVIYKKRITLRRISGL